VASDSSEGAAPEAEQSTQPDCRHQILTAGLSIGADAARSAAAAPVNLGAAFLDAAHHLGDAGAHALGAVKAAVGTGRAAAAVERPVAAVRYLRAREEVGERERVRE
jgi:hypothetical protein